MLKNHIGFTGFIVLLLLAPKVPLPIIATRSSLSLGIVGLLIWSIISPEYILRLRKTSQLKLPLVFFIFAFYTLLISIISMEKASIIYAVQYFLYCFLTLLLFSNYIYSALKNKQLNFVFKLLIILSFIYSLGALFSVYNGPIYPHQTQWTQRLWGNARIHQGVGFGENQNGTGGILVIVFPIVFYLDKIRFFQFNNLSKIIVLFALLSTVSRSAILSFFISMLLTLIVSELKSILLKKIKINTLITLLTSIVFLWLIIAIVWYAKDSSHLLGAILEGFGLKNKTYITGDINVRWSYWVNGLVQWDEAALLKKIFGGGFRSSMVINEYGVWHSPHNAYIAILVDFGLVGLMLFLMPLWIIWKRLIGNLFRNEAGYLEKALFMAVTAIVIHNMTEVFFYSPMILSLTMLLLVIDSRVTINKSNKIGKAKNA